MNCPFCRNPDSRVIDTRSTDEGTVIRRRRECPECGKRFTTSETAALTVLKRGGAVVPFSRTKVIEGVRKACQGRPVTEHELSLLAQQVEDNLRATGAAQVRAKEIGLAILPFLRRLDQVAYLRFASVYENFESLTDFEEAIIGLRAELAAAGDGRDIFKISDFRSKHHY